MTNYTVAPDCQIPSLVKIYEDCFGERPFGYYVEVGAFDGKNWSNSIGLARLGWRGLLVEPYEEYYLKCLENYREYLTKNISVENVACGDKDGTLALYMGGSNTTTVRGMVKLYNDMEWSKFSGLDERRQRTVRAFRLDTLLARYQYPRIFDLAIIDVEGAELNVLHGLDTQRFQPEMFIVECHEDYPDPRLSMKAKAINRWMDKRGYQKIYHDYINNIYWQDLSKERENHNG